MSYRKPIATGALKLKKFDLTQLSPNSTICMIAKRDSGKSWIVRDILWHKKEMPCGVIICPTDKMNSFYGSFFPQLYIHYKYEPMILENLICRQKLMMKKLSEKNKDHKTFDPHCVLIMDDCMADKEAWKKDPLVNEIFMNGRHYKLMYILTMQYALGITPEQRTNFDYIFILADAFYSNQKRIFEHYAGMFPDFETFRTVFAECTRDYSCMVINNKARTGKIEDSVFWFKASPREQFEMGCKQFRKFSAVNFESDWENRPRLFDIADLQRSKKKFNLTVDKIDEEIEED